MKQAFTDCSTKRLPVINGIRYFETDKSDVNLNIILIIMAYSKTTVIAESTPSPFSDLSHLNTGQC